MEVEDEVLRHIVPSWNPEVRAIIFERLSDERKSTPSWNKVPLFLPRVSRADKRMEKGLREDTRGRGPSRGTQFPALSIPSSVHPTSVLRTHVGRQDSLRLYPLGNEEIGFRYYSRNLKPPLLRLSLNAAIFGLLSFAAALGNWILFFILLVKSCFIF